MIYNSYVLKRYIFISSFSIFLVLVGSIVPTVMLISKKNTVNNYIDFVDKGYDDFIEDNDELINEHNKVFPFDVNKYYSINSSDISTFISSYYYELYGNSQNRKVSDQFITLHDNINIDYKIDSYIKKQDKKFNIIPKASIDINYKKARMVSNFRLFIINLLDIIMSKVEKIKNNKILNDEIYYEIFIKLLKWFNSNSLFISLNNNYRNFYNVNFEKFSVSLKKSYVGSLIFVPMYANAIDWTIEPFTINKIDISFISNIIRNPINEIYSLFNNNIKTFIDSFYNFFSFVQTLSPKLNFDKLLPIINVSNYDDIKTKKINFGNFQIIEWNAKDNALYITSNNICKTSISMQKSSCNGALCSHNHIGINRIIPDFKKWAISILGTESFSKISRILIKLILPLLSTVTLFVPGLQILLSTLTLLLNIGYDLVEDIYNNIEKLFYDFFNKFFDLNNYSFKYIFDKIFRILVNILNDNAYEIAKKYAGEFPYHGFDVGKCSTALINLKIDTRKKIPLKEDNYYIYGTNNYKNIISSIFDIKDNKIVFDKDVIISIFELDNYAKFYDYLINDEEIPYKIVNIFKNNIYNMSVTSNGLYDQYIKYKNQGVTPKIYYKKLPYFEKFINKGFVINRKINILDFDLLKEQILSDIIYQNIYLQLENGQKIMIFENGKMKDIYLDGIKKFDNNKNYIYIELKEIGNNIEG